MSKATRIASRRSISVRIAVVGIIVISLVVYAGIAITRYPFPRQLAKAIRSDDTQRVERLLARGVDPNCTFSSPLYSDVFQFPLEMAVRHRAVGSVRALLRAHAPAERCTDTGVTPLTLAVQLQFWDVAEALIQGGADPNGLANQNGVTPLLCAVSAGDLEGVKRLIEWNADVNLVPRSTRRPVLFDAAMNPKLGCRRVEFVAVLLAAGARTDVRDDSGKGLIEAVNDHNVDCRSEVLELLK